MAGNDSDTETTTVSTSADLSIAKSDSVDPVVAGTNFTYTLIVTNAGPSDATSVAVTDTLPAGVSYVSGTVSGGSGTETCTELGGVVSCDLGLLGNGASETIDIVVTVDPSVADGTVLSNSAVVSAATSDPNAVNDTDSEDTTVSTSADLSVSKTDGADPVVAGTRLLLHGDRVQRRSVRRGERQPHRRPCLLASNFVSARLRRRAPVSEAGWHCDVLAGHDR